MNGDDNEVHIYFRVHLREQAVCQKLMAMLTTNAQMITKRALSAFVKKEICQFELFP